jgi:hypothetical protein
VEKHVPSMNGKSPWGLNAQSDIASPNPNDFDLDVIADHDTLFLVA